MQIAWLGIGSNLDNPRQQIKSGLAALDKYIDVMAISDIYQTKALGKTDQPDFLNAVIKIATLLSPPQLLELCQKIELQHGRQRQQKWGPRTLDIDILLYGDMIINTENLTIPHEMMTKRAFVLVPLADLAPELLIPGNQKTVAQLAQNAEIKQQEIRK